MEDDMNRKPTQSDMFYRAGRAITAKHLTMLDLLFGPNPVTDDELRALIAKRPAVYGQYASYLGKRGAV